MKERVALFGATGTMGHQALRELWRRRDRYDLVLLVRPFARNRKLLRRYLRESGIGVGPGLVVQGEGLKVVWGDATCYDDVAEAVEGVDWVLDAMAFISPQADYYPETAKAVNTRAIEHIVRAIEAQPGGAERIRLVYTGTVAETGDRLGRIHMGRVGDPLKPSIFDYYAVTKIAGERAVLESNLRHWASLRMTYIMPTNYQDYASLVDPILFHQPLNTRMENLSDRDAGYGLVNALEIPTESDFWRRVYNMGGGPAMRCTAYEYMNRTFQELGLSGLEACTERRWFALRNFHMQYYEDSAVLNEYLHHGRDSLDDYWTALRASMPVGIRLLSSLARRVPALRRQVEQATYRRLRRLATEHRNGTAHWVQQENEPRITAFYGNRATYESIPEWGAETSLPDMDDEWVRLDHGYDEGKTHLSLDDLRQAAAFRGGQCLADTWDGDWYRALRWRCAFDHEFSARPYTVLKAGHWCPVCVAPPWTYDEEARRNPFFSQVWLANRDASEDRCYPEELCRDIAGADKG